MNIPYQPLRPVVAAWSLEFAEAIGVVFFQLEDSAVNVIGSKLWRFASLAQAIAELSEYPWRRRIESHLIPPDSGGVWSSIFDQATLTVDIGESADAVQTVYVTRELFPLLRIDTEPRPWIEHGKNNDELVQSINGYRADPVKQSETFSRNPVHSWERYLVRALEIYAIWRHNGGGSTGWLPKANYDAYNRGVI